MRFAYWIKYPIYTCTHIRLLFHNTYKPGLGYAQIRTLCGVVEGVAEHRTSGNRRWPVHQVNGGQNTLPQQLVTFAFNSNHNSCHDTVT
jgi:hypothetical protein